MPIFLHFYWNKCIQIQLYYYPATLPLLWEFSAFETKTLFYELDLDLALLHQITSYTCRGIYYKFMCLRCQHCARSRPLRLNYRRARRCTYLTNIIARCSVHTQFCLNKISRDAPFKLTASYSVRWFWCGHPAAQPGWPERAERQRRSDRHPPLHEPGGGTPEAIWQACRRLEHR